MASKLFIWRKGMVAASAVAVVAVAACSTASKPPVVDGESRRPVNNREAVADLSSRAQSPRVAFKTEAPAQPTTPAGAARLVPQPARVLSVQFAYNSTRPQMAPEQTRQLAGSLGTAVRIVIHVQTSTTQGSADERLALNRALAVKQFLVAQGATPQTISVNYIARESRENREGRDWSRQADIEIITSGANP